MRPRTVEVHLAVHSIGTTRVGISNSLLAPRSRLLLSARRALIEDAWAYRYPAKVSRHLQLRLAKVPKAIQIIGWIQGVINKERQALLEEIIGGLPKSKGIEQEGLIYDLYTKIGWNDYRNAANEYLLSVLNRRRTDETNLYTINSASCCGVYPDRLLLE